MGVPSLFKSLLSLAALAATVSAQDFAIITRGTRNVVNETQVRVAMNCLGEWCEEKKIEPDAKVRCVIGDAVVYICNYGGYQPCSARELESKYLVLQEKTSSTTGWYYSKDWQKTYVNSHSCHT